MLRTKGLTDKLIVLGIDGMDPRFSKAMVDEGKMPNLKKLIDMGAALRYTCGHQRQQLCMGTPGYNPKEQWKETKGNLTWDIYGLGAVLHEMLTGANPMRPPYERRALREYNKGFSKGLEQIIEVCTRKKSTDRYQNAEQLRQALENHHKLGRKSRCWWRRSCIICRNFI